MFDFTRAQRRSYYHPAGPETAQTDSSATAASTSTAVSNAAPTAKHLASPLPLGLPSRPATPSDRTGLVSRTGLDVEAQILDGGGMATTGGRGWKGAVETGRDSVDARMTPLRQPTPMSP